jgi:5-methylthioribose kinase
MKDVLKTAIPAFIALIGTVLVVLMGYRQWRRQQDTSRESEFRTQKQQTYMQLWEKLEDVHVRLRTEVVGGDEFRALVRDVNSYILKRGLFLEDDDQALANRYMSKVREFAGLVAACDSADLKRAFNDTEAIPPAVVRFAQESGDIQAEVNRIREKLLMRYRSVLRGDKDAK